MCKRDVPNCTREVDGCAKGTSQIAHRMSLSVLILYSYVQFGTSLLHIPFAHQRGSGEGLMHMRRVFAIRGMAGSSTLLKDTRNMPASSEGKVRR